MGRLAIGGVLATVLLTGCQSSYPNLDEQRSLNAASIESLNRVHVDQAIIAQRTIYPYHFEQGGAKLNQLGERDLKVLASACAERALILNVYQGEADADLYRDRLHAVQKSLAAHGVDVNRVTFRSGLPSGDGLDSDQSLNALEPSRDKRRGQSSAESMQENR